MPKSLAERSKTFRETHKNDPLWRKKESDRVRKSKEKRLQKLLSSEVSMLKAKQAEYCRRYREKKKAEKIASTKNIEGTVNHFNE